MLPHSGVSGAWSWGNGAGGRLGLGDQKDRYDPCGIPKLRGKSLMMVAAGSWHSLALVQYPPMKNGGMVLFHCHCLGYMQRLNWRYISLCV